jgi:hypothetical protein
LLCCRLVSFLCPFHGEEGRRLAGIDPLGFCQVVAGPSAAGTINRASTSRASSVDALTASSSLGCFLCRKRSKRSLSDRSIKSSKPLACLTVSRASCLAKNRSMNRSFSSKPRRQPHRSLLSERSSSNGEFTTVNDSGRADVTVTVSDCAQNHHFLDLANRLGWIQALRADVNAIHDGVAAE